MFGVAASGALAALALAAIHPWATQRLPDVPTERSSHTTPVPRGGGLAIVAGALAAWWLVLGLTTGIRDAPAVVSGAALILVAISLRDDFAPVPVPVKLGVQIVVALIAVAATGTWSRYALPWIGPVTLHQFGTVLAVVWVVGLTNAYNFMDGIDGLAATQAMVAGLAWAFIASWRADWATAALGAGIAIGCAMFLTRNWHPATIFMGDVGSTFLGFALAMLPMVHAHFVRPRAGAPAAAVLASGPFVFDTVFTFLRRLARGENVFQAHRSHLYQRLVIAGWSHPRVCVLYGALAAIGAALSAVVFSGKPVRVDIASAIGVLCGLGLWLTTVAAERNARRRAGAA